MTTAHPPERAPGFVYRAGKGILRKSPTAMFADKVPLARLAEVYGTPLYVYSATAIRQRYLEFDHAFNGCDHTICYSVKANSSLAIMGLLAELNAGFDIVSAGELQRVVKVSRKSTAKTVFSGVGKLATEIDQALSTGILMFNVESAGELEVLASRASHLRKNAQFAIRANPDVTAETHPYISTGLHEHKFGVPWCDVAELYRIGARARYLKAAGVSVHIGSQITDVGPFGEAMERVASLVRSLHADQHDIRFVDAGGGLGIFYRKNSADDFAKLAKQYSAALLAPMKSLGVHLLLEPGRAIVGPAGILITRVIYRKRNGGKQFVVVDAGMNDLLRPSLYNAYHEIVPVALNGGAIEKVDVVGPVCETGDFLARDRDLPTVKEGDLLAVLDAGAYGMALASNYNSRSRPAEVLVDGARQRLVRKRESIRDLIALERL